MLIEWTLIIEGKATDLREVPPGADITEVDGAVCLGLCEACGQPILNYERAFFSDAESGIVIHATCDNEKED